MNRRFIVSSWICSVDSQYGKKKCHFPHWRHYPKECLWIIHLVCTHLCCKATNAGSERLDDSCRDFPLYCWCLMRSCLFDVVHLFIEIARAIQVSLEVADPEMVRVMCLSVGQDQVSSSAAVSSKETEYISRGDRRGMQSRGRFHFSLPVLSRMAYRSPYFGLCYTGCWRGGAWQCISRLSCIKLHPLHRRWLVWCVCPWRWSVQFSCSKRRSCDLHTRSY